MLTITTEPAQSDTKNVVEPFPRFNRKGSRYSPYDMVPMIWSI